MPVSNKTFETTEFPWLVDDSRKFLSRGYLPPGMSAEERIRNIADHAESILGIRGYAEKFYGYMSQGFYSLASPIWSNFGTDRGLPVSCFGTYIDDSIASILQGTGEVGTMAKFGGGCSGYWTPVRPRGSIIGNNNGKTFGSVHFMELFETLTSVISQGSVRRGFFSPYLDIEHGDAEEFIGIQGDSHPIQGLTHGVTVSDDFISRVKSRDSHAGALWAQVIEHRFNHGLPYIMFTDNMNNGTVDVYRDKGMKILASNMCVAPETKILTDRGYKRIADLSDSVVNVWNGSEFSSARVEKTSNNESLLTVITDTGQTLECTPYHKFYVQSGYGCKIVEKRANELEPGDKLIKMDRPVIEGRKNLYKPYENGFYSGDGCEVNNRARIYLYGTKRRLAHLFEKLSHTVQGEHDREYFYVEGLKEKFFVPNAEYTIEDRLNWLSGLVDSDGCKSLNGETQSIQIASINRVFLREIQRMLDTLGVQSNISTMRDAGARELPVNDGSGDMKNYSCQSLERILIGETGLQRLLELGFESKRLNFATREPNRQSSRFSKIVSVENHGRRDATYCFNEPKRHLGVFNGLLTGQCTEIALPQTPEESFVCVLSSINAVKFDQIKKTDAVKTLAYFLDAVVTEFLNRLDEIGETEPLLRQHMERAYRFAKRHRALGMGVLGWHTALQEKMYAFDSVEAAKLNVELFKHIQNEAWQASRELADMFGEPEVLEGYGRRNTTLTAVAPTKSSSFILGQVSQGIEPLLTNYFIDDKSKVKNTYKNPTLVNLLEERGKNTRDVWKQIAKNDGSVQNLDCLSDHEKEVFKTFGEISQHAIVNQAGVRQSWIDQGQSLNLRIGPSATAKEVNELLMLGHSIGVKTFYYQRSASAAQEAARNNSDCVACEG